MLLTSRTAESSLSSVSRSRVDAYRSCGFFCRHRETIFRSGPGTLEFPEYDGNSMYRTLGNISRNPNVGLLFVKFDGQSYRIRINGRAEILDDAETLARHHAAKLVVRVQCELFSNCPRAVVLCG